MSSHVPFFVFWDLLLLLMLQNSNGHDHDQNLHLSLYLVTCLLILVWHQFERLAFHLNTIL